jgi:nicotinamidase-related amidase
MATVRKGNSKVLVIVDVQVNIMKDAWEAKRIINNVARIVENARTNNIPVLWVKHSDDELLNGSAGWQWVPALVPAQNEPQLHKHFNSSFEQTRLEDELAKVSATHVVLAGALTNWCIRSTAFAALERGYDLTLVTDAHTTTATELEDGEVIEAESLVKELNVAMTWLTYPGRKNMAVNTEALDFSSAA